MAAFQGSGKLRYGWAVAPYTYFVFHNWLYYFAGLFCFVCPDGSTKSLITEEQRGTEKPQQSSISVDHLESSADPELH